MQCPFCLENSTKVVDSRKTPNQNSTRRRRECKECDKRFTTYERVETTNLNVVKKDGTRESFSRDKLLAGMVRACEKRPISHDDIQSSVSAIEADLLAKDRNEITSRTLGKMVMRQLKELDHVAYVRFASVYRRFRDISQFEKEIVKIRQNAQD